MILAIMRVNGFSVAQTIGYLVRETLATTLLGFGVAILGGNAMIGSIIRVVENPDSMFDRGLCVIAWVLAVLIEAVFAGVINAIAFSKVRRLKVTDIPR